MLAARKISTTPAEDGVARQQMMEHTAARTTKLYGQIRPKIQLGGCQAGCSSPRYQEPLLLTHTPESAM